MDDKITSSDNTSEYKFSDSEGGEQYNTPDTGSVVTDAVVTQPDSKFNFSGINWKRFIAPGMAIVAIMVVYTIFSFSSSRKNNIAENQKIMAQEDAALVQQQQAAVLAAKPVAVDVSNNEQQLAQMRGMMQQEVDTVLQQVKNSQGNVANVSGMISKTQQDVANVGKQVEQLTTVMQQMLVEIDKLKASKKAKPKKKSFKLPVAYHVHAIVPGRVWLESAKGDSVSLRVGDRLEGYGTVKDIAPDKGMVVMSNGSIIQYGVDDF